MELSSSLWPESAYRIDLDHTDSAALPAAAEELFGRVWRTSLDRPGFGLVRFNQSIDSRQLRRVMFGILDNFPVRFVPERLGRFDQQVSSRFHRDGAPSASLLVLGYEPSEIYSRVYVADAHRAAFAEQLSIADFLSRYNPMFPVGEEKLLPYITEIAIPRNESFIIVINNSLLPLHEANPLGLLHKAEVPDPDASAARIINSMGLILLEDAAGNVKSGAEIDHFLNRDDVD